MCRPACTTRLSGNVWYRRLSIDTQNWDYHMYLRVCKMLAGCGETEGHGHRGTWARRGTGTKEHGHREARAHSRVNCVPPAPAVPASTRISARLQRVQRQSSPAGEHAQAAARVGLGDEMTHQSCTPRSSARTPASRNPAPNATCVDSTRSVASPAAFYIAHVSKTWYPR